jgi:hypothetical protein
MSIALGAPACRSSGDAAQPLTDRRILATLDDGFIEGCSQPCWGVIAVPVNPTGGNQSRDTRKKDDGKTEGEGGKGSSNFVKIANNVWNILRTVAK